MKEVIEVVERLEISTRYTLLHEEFGKTEEFTRDSRQILRLQVETVLPRERAVGGFVGRSKVGETIPTVRITFGKKNPNRESLNEPFHTLSFVYVTEGDFD